MEVFVSFTGGGKTDFTPEQQHKIQQSIDALQTNTGLIIDQCRSARDAVEFDVKTTTGIRLTTVRYHNDADGLNLYSDPADFDALFVEPNRQMFRLG